MPHKVLLPWYIVGLLSIGIPLTIYQWTTVIRTILVKRRALRPAVPELLLPIGWATWQWDGQCLRKWEWTATGWKRTRSTIEAKDIPEIEEHK